MVPWPYSLTIALLAIAVWLLCRWQGIRLRRRVAQVQTWPEVEVEILQSQPPAPGMRAVAPRVVFGWSDQGQLRRSRRIQVGAWTGTRRQAVEFTAAHPVGRRLRARRNPSDPGDAILYPRGDVQAWFRAGDWIAGSMLIAALLLILFGRG